jgi:DNA-directed RNA polymerase specialized sigma24 family protein
MPGPPTLPFVGPYTQRAAFEALYDRHESSVFNFCLRVVGSRDAAAAATKAAFLRVWESPEPAWDGADALVHLLSAARRECAELVEPAQEGEAAAVTSSVRVRDANRRLEARHREVLALRDLLGCSHREIGRIVGADRATIAELLWHARLELRDELEGSTLLSIAPVAPSCRRALALIVMNWDGELDDAEEREWLQRHLRTCGKCRMSQEALRQASVSYHEWLPGAPPLGMRASLLDAGGGPSR